MINKDGGALTPQRWMINQYADDWGIDVRKVIQAAIGVWCRVDDLGFNDAVHVCKYIGKQQKDWKDKRRKANMDRLKEGLNDK